MRKILVIHGPNLNLLGEREPGVYGRATLAEIDARLKQLAQKHGFGLRVLQSNHEGDLVTAIGKSRKDSGGILINPAAYTHTSVAIRDALSASGLPVVEVHLSNIYARESFRQHSLISPVTIGQVSGFGARSYEWGFLALAFHIKSTQADAPARTKAPGKK